MKADTPHDAVLRGMGSKMPSGRLVGDEFSIPTTVLNEAPGNQDVSFEHVEEGFRIQVQKLSQATGHSDLSKSLRKLKCCCCGLMFEGRQHFNQDTGWGLGDCCIDYVVPHAEEFERTYGVYGVHYGVAR